MDAKIDAAETPTSTNDSFYYSDDSQPIKVHESPVTDKTTGGLDVVNSLEEDSTPLSYPDHHSITPARPPGRKRKRNENNEGVFRKL